MSGTETAFPEGGHTGGPKILCLQCGKPGDSLYCSALCLVRHSLDSDRYDRDNIVQVYPREDVCLHEVDCTLPVCICGPKVRRGTDGLAFVVHNALDGRKEPSDGLQG